MKIKKSFCELIIKYGFWSFAFVFLVLFVNTILNSFFKLESINFYYLSIPALLLIVRFINDNNLLAWDATYLEHTFKIERFSFFIVFIFLVNYVAFLDGIKITFAVEIFLVLSLFISFLLSQFFILRFKEVEFKYLLSCLDNKNFFKLDELYSNYFLEKKLILPDDKKILLEIAKILNERFMVKHTVVPLECLLKDLLPDDKPFFVLERELKLITDGSHLEIFQVRTVNDFLYYFTAVIAYRYALSELQGFLPSVKDYEKIKYAKRFLNEARENNKKIVATATRDLSTKIQAEEAKVNDFEIIFSSIIEVEKQGQSDIAKLKNNISLLSKSKELSKKNYIPKEISEKVSKLYENLKLKILVGDVEENINQSITLFSSADKSLKELNYLKAEELFNSSLQELHYAKNGISNSNYQSLAVFEVYKKNIDNKIVEIKEKFTQIRKQKDEYQLFNRKLQKSKSGVITIPKEEDIFFKRKLKM